MAARTVLGCLQASRMENDCGPSISEAPREVKDDVGLGNVKESDLEYLFQAPLNWQGKYFRGVAKHAQLVWSGIVPKCQDKISEGLLYYWQVVGHFRMILEFWNLNAILKRLELCRTFLQTLVEMDTGGDAFLKQVVDVYVPFGCD